MSSLPAHHSADMAQSGVSQFQYYLERDKLETVNVERSNPTAVPTEDEIVRNARVRGVTPRQSWEAASVVKLTDSTFRITRKAKAKDRDLARRRLIITQSDRIGELEEQFPRQLREQEDKLESLNARVEDLGARVIELTKLSKEQRVTLRKCKEYLLEERGNKIIFARHSTFDHILKVIDKKFQQNRGNALKAKVSTLIKLNIFNLEDLLFEEQNGFKGQQQAAYNALEDILGSATHKLAYRSYVHMGGENGLRKIRNELAHVTVNEQRAMNYVRTVSDDEEWEDRKVLQGVAWSIISTTHYFVSGKLKGWFFTPAEDDTSGIKEVESLQADVDAKLVKADEAIKKGEEAVAQINSIKKLYSKAHIPV